MPARGDQTQATDRGERLRAQFGIERNADPLAAAAEVKRSFRAAIAVILDDEALNT